MKKLINKRKKKRKRKGNENERRLARMEGRRHTCKSTPL